jgi:hypothetical protein
MDFGSNIGSIRSLTGTVFQKGKVLMKFKFRGFISLLLACCFLVASVSGIVLYVTPKGRVANWTNWSMLGLDKHGWSAVHMNACLLVLVASGVHLVLNWRVFTSYIKRKSAGLNLKLEMATALLMTTIVVAGTVLDAQPFRSTVALNETIKAHWERQAPAGPAPHAEEFSVAVLASNIGLSLEQVTTALEREGFDVGSSDRSIGQLAAKSGVAPSDVFAAIQKHYPNSAVGPPGLGRGRGMGGGPWRPSDGAEAGHLTTLDSEGDHEAFGRGPGRGQGRGLGRGQGRGARGPGMGMGRGPGSGFDGEAAGDQD